jgi:predicted  nucleic acid-binding Zn-ribbon protein
MTTAAPPTDDLESEIQRLKADLQNAEAARVRPEDAAADAIREQLKRKEAELRASQELESQVISAQQRALDLQTLAQMESDISKAKAETNTLRAMLTELPQRLSRAQFQLNELLRTHAKLKADLGI